MPGPASVVKLGGSILRSASGYRRCAELIADERRRGRRPWVVVSAAYGVTEELLRLPPRGARPGRADLVERHLELADAPGDGHLAGWLRRSLEHALRRGGDSPLAWGEQASTATFRIHLARLGVLLPVVELTPTGVPAASDGAVVPGFYLRVGPDEVRCLSRGAGDLSAVLVASGVGARTARLWKRGGAIRLAGRIVEEIDAATLLPALRDPLRPVHVGALGLAALKGIDLVLEDPLDAGPSTRVLAAAPRGAGPGAPSLLAAPSPESPVPLGLGTTRTAA